MPEPIMMALAAAAVGKVSEKMYDGSLELLKEAGRRISARFKSGGEEAVLLERAEHGGPELEKLAEAVRAACAADSEFKAELEKILNRSIPVQVMNVHNSGSGSIGTQLNVNGTVNIENLGG